MRSKRSFRALLISALLVSAPSVCAADALCVGDCGSTVAEVQSALSGLGYDVMVDGDFGPATEAAVKEFQISRGLFASGEVDPSVFEALVGRRLAGVSRGGEQRSRRIVSVAMRYMGVPYVYGGASPSGFDCSGFVYFVFGEIGVSLPRTADTQFEVGRRVEKRALRAGDLVFFSADGYEISHVGIYLNKGEFIHASTEYGIAIDSLERDYRRTHYAGARRVI